MFKFFKGIGTNFTNLIFQQNNKNEFIKVNKIDEQNITKRELVLNNDVLSIGKIGQSDHLMPV